MKNQIGIIGLGTMGRALALNLCNHDFKVSGYNRSYSTTKQLMEEHANFSGYETISDFVNSLELPRKIILMVPAGPIVDAFIEILLEHLSKNDILMDCGNSYYKDTMKRVEALSKKHVIFFGIGVSGGEKGALLGPSIMPGGEKEYYPSIQPFLEAIAAKKNEAPCCTYIGPSGSGHYVKMVHNGIEYADMQLIVEVYLYFKYIKKYDNQKIATIFEQWNSTLLKSYLIEITANILREKDYKTDSDLVDMIVDQASQKGTGKWTVMEATDQGQCVSLIQAAVTARIVSNLQFERSRLCQALDTNSNQTFIDTLTIEQVESAYLIGKLVTYAQGFSMMHQASIAYHWKLNFEHIASIFRAGCIIQAELLDKLMAIFNDSPDIGNFLLHPDILLYLQEGLQNLRDLNIAAMTNKLPMPVLSSALTYLDQLSATSVGANLIQAQRDYFGAHTFERIDQKGAVHHEWTNE